MVSIFAILNVLLPLIATAKKVLQLNLCQLILGYLQTEKDGSKCDSRFPYAVLSPRRHYQRLI